MITDTSTACFPLLLTRTWTRRCGLCKAANYYREGMAGPEEVYSVLDYNWDKPRDPKYLERLTILQQTIQGIMSSSLTES